MTTDHYAGAGRRWAEGATLVYGPIARQLVARSPHPLAGRTVLDAGAGTGVASDALRSVGACPVAADLSYDMLAYAAESRPPAVIADVRALPLADASVDDCVAAFVLNHLKDPERGLTELARVTRRNGVVIACVYSNQSRSEVRDLIDVTARQLGWTVPDWYADLKAHAAPLLGSAEGVRRLRSASGLGEVAVDESAVDVGVTRAEELVDYRFGQAQFAEWLARLGPAGAARVRLRAIEAIRRVMRPYQPIVVFLTGVVCA